MEAEGSYHGSLVAFEGPSDVLSTQLRLLPTSPKILTLPPLQNFIKNESGDLPFDARSYVLKIHEACQARAEMAQNFLKNSAPDDKRLVFMNGGTSSAQAKCISTIGDRLTRGDLTKAESIFTELVRNGLAGLRRRDRHLLPAFDEDEDQQARRDDDLDQGDSEDPISKAMKAADALDRETESLQPSTEVDLTLDSRPRSLSLPTSRMADDLQEAAPFYLFRSPENGATLPPLDTGRSLSSAMDLHRMSGTESVQGSRLATWRVLTALEGNGVNPNEPPRTPSCAGEAYPSPTTSTAPSHLDLLSPRSTGGYDSMPGTPGTPGVVTEAYVVDVRASDSTYSSNHRRIKSVDRIYASAIRNQDISLSHMARNDIEKVPDTNRIMAGVQTMGSYMHEKQLLRSKFFSEIPRATFAKPSRTTIKRGPPSPLILGGISRRPISYMDQSTMLGSSYADQATSTESRYVDKGVDAEDVAALYNLADDDFELGADTPFEVVLPMVEDMVVHFKSEQSDQLLERTLQGFNNGAYPISMPPLLREPEDVSSGPSTPNSRRSTPTPTPRQKKDIESNGFESPVAAASPAVQGESDEYDPFASHGDYLSPPGSWPVPPQDQGQEHPVPETPQKAIMPAAPPAPPTPEATLKSKNSNITATKPNRPNLHQPPPDKTFHEFITTGCQTAVYMQNALRSVLNIYFPPEDSGYHRYTFPLLPELSGLWKPVFRDSDSGSNTNTRRERCKIDLILAIGAQRGVNKEFVSAITGSLEKLGTKPNGVTRSGRLDLRFLIANAMQAFTSQPLANQTQDNPFSNPLLLATLIIPFLETYMAAHADTRFLLLEFPPEHLTTVLALQRLIGVDLVKVAGVLDAEAGEPKPYPGFKSQPSLRHRHSAGPSLSRMSTTSISTTATLIASPGSTLNESSTNLTPSFGKANFLLTSTASESEIATLISTIWRILVDISHFYIPEGAPLPRASMSSLKRESWDSLSKPASAKQERSHNKRNSRDRPVATTPLIDPATFMTGYAPLVSAAVMMGFASPPAASPTSPVAEVHSQPNSCATTPTELTFAGSKNGSKMAPPPPPKKDRKQRLNGDSLRPSSKASTSIGNSIRSSKTVRTIASQRTRLRYMLSTRDGASITGDDAASSRPGTAGDGSYFDISDDEDGGRFAAEERYYMPLFGRKLNRDTGDGVKKGGNSRKALRLLGLSVDE